MENVRIAVLDTNDAVKTFLDNAAPNALHYYDDELHEYLQGAAATYKLTALSDCEDAQYLIEGNKLAFSYNGKDYYFNIVRVEKDEVEIMIEAYSLSFELLNEYVDKYDPGKAIPFSEYLNAFDPEHVLAVGKNEVSQMNIWQKFEDNQTILGRLFAVADAFNVELEFVTELNSNHSLKRIIVNVYREHSDRFQGMGNDRTDITLRYGTNVTGITKKSSIENLYTAIRPVGNDGIDIVNVQGKVLDDNEEVEFFTEKGSPDVRAPQARDRFPSNLFTEDRYIVQYKSFEESDSQSLYLTAVNELRKACVPEVEYNVEGFFDTAIGDTVSIEDREFNPVLYLQARVTEQIRSFTDPTRNKTVFSNFKELQSQLSDETIRRMQEMINANKVYTCSIVTDNGIVFKNNSGETTLTASIMDGGVDMTDTLTINWTKDGAKIGSGKSIKVTAADVEEKSVYRYEAVDASGKYRGSYEVTVMDVKDGEPGLNGKAQYLHTKFSNDGGKTFTVNNGETPGKFMGYYVDFAETDSNNPDDYTWVKVEGDKGDSGKDATAYSMQVSAYAIVRATDGKYTPENITVSGKSQTGAEALKEYACRFKIEETTDMEIWTTRYTSEKNEISNVYTPSKGIQALCCSMYLADGTSTLLDRQIIPVVSDGEAGLDGDPGKDAYTIVLSNESHTFAGSTSAALAGSTICKVIAYKGVTPMPATIGTISGLPTGMTASVQNNGKTNAQFTVNVTTAMKTKSGELTVQITVDGKSFTKTFSFALALKGDEGKPGDPGDKGDPTGVLELPTEPPTKFDGMLWKCTGNLSGFIRDAVYRWNGKSWELFTFSAKNIEAEELSAIVANLGTITAGIIKNEDGTFGIDAFNGNIDSYDNYKRIFPNGAMGYTRMLLNAGTLAFRLYPVPYDPNADGVWDPDVELNGAGVWKNGVEAFEKIEEIENRAPIKLVSTADVIQGAMVNIPSNNRKALIVMCGVSGQFTQCIIPKSYRGTSRVTCYYSAGTAVTFEFALLDDNNLSITRIYKEGAWASYNVQMEIWGI